MRGRSRQSSTGRKEKVIHYTTQKILKFLPDILVEYVQNDYPRHARDKDVIMYIYVVDQNEHLLGIVDLKDLLRADDKAPLRDVMVENVISIPTDSYPQGGSTGVRPVRVPGPSGGGRGEPPRGGNSVPGCDESHASLRRVNPAQEQPVSGFSDHNIFSPSKVLSMTV